MRVAIALAVYKPDLELLSEQLASLMAQTYSDWFLVVHDDASMQPEALRDAIGKVVPADRFSVARAETRQGAVGNFGAALSHVPADCQLIAFCDQDDEWVPTKLARLVATFTTSEVMAVHSDLSLTDREGRETAASCWSVEKRDVGHLTPRKIIFRNPVTGCAMMFRRELLNDILPIPQQPHPPFYFHDAWVALAALHRGRIVSLAESLVRYRQHGGNAVGAERAGGVKLSRARAKCLRAFETRVQLEQDWRARSGVDHRLFDTGFDLGFRILARTFFWALNVSRGYLRIGLQLALGKLFWDLRGGRRDS